VCLETLPDHLGREENRDFRSHFQKKVKEGLNMSIFSAACEHGYLIISAIKLFIGVRGIFFNCTYAVGTMYSGRGWHHVLRPRLAPCTPATCRLRCCLVWLTLFLNQDKAKLLRSHSRICGPENFSANLVQLEVTDCSLGIQHLLHSYGDLVELFAFHLISELFQFRAQRVAAA
jgi:hypothetical protein